MLTVTVGKQHNNNKVLDHIKKGLPRDRNVRRNDGSDGQNSISPPIQREEHRVQGARAQCC